MALRGHYELRCGMGWLLGAAYYSASQVMLQAGGPDVIVGEIQQVTDYSRSQTTVAISMTTISCNNGDRPLDWLELPSHRHPVIAQNMYRLKDGRMTQIGQAWVKHGFAALQLQSCFNDCRPQPYTRLGVHCSDPYSEYLNRGPELGARHEINPVNGYFDGATANQHGHHVHTGISHGLQVRQSDLGNPGARYFVEVQYIAADDALAGNGNNNASYREVEVSGTPSDWIFDVRATRTVRELPAIQAWPGATIVELDSWPEDGRIIVAYKVTKALSSIHRYDYAVYNMNSERGIYSLTIPADSNENVFGFAAVRSHDDPFSNEEWAVSVIGEHVQWRTGAANEPGHSNPIRWGTMYNFWIETVNPPVPAMAALGRYKPGGGPNVLRARVLAPSSGDCNENGIADSEDISGGTSTDEDADGIPDECVPCTMSDGCGPTTPCLRHWCDDGWCAEAALLYGDADRDGGLAQEDLECVQAAFRNAGACPGGRLFPCEPDDEVTMDDLLAALIAFDGHDICCR